MMLCCVEIWLWLSYKESYLKPYEETNDVSHARTFFISHEESPLFPHAGQNGDPPWGGG